MNFASAKPFAEQPIYESHAHILATQVPLIHEPFGSFVEALTGKSMLGSECATGWCHPVGGTGQQPPSRYG